MWTAAISGGDSPRVDAFFHSASSRSRSRRVEMTKRKGSAGDCCGCDTRGSVATNAGRASRPKAARSAGSAATVVHRGCAMRTHVRRDEHAAHLLTGN
jgi:hypothetical protein